MTRLKKPKGLIRYSGGGRDLLARAAAYGAILLVVGVALSIALTRRQPVELELVRAPEAPYQDRGDGRVINHFKINIQNQTFEDVQVTFESAARIVVSNHAETLVAGKSERADLFVEFTKTALTLGKGEARVRMIVRAAGSRESIQDSTQEVRLVGPYR
jgi:hypothetical protein